MGDGFGVMGINGVQLSMSMTSDDIGVNDTDDTTVYESDDGEQRTFAQIAMAGAKDPGVTVEPADDVEEGYYVNGTLYTPVEENEQGGL